MSSKNLKPFRKGPDPRRNLKGQPKKIPSLENLLAECMEDQWQSIIRALLKKAIKGDVRAAEVLLDRAFGKAKQFINSGPSVIRIEAPDPDTQRLLDDVKRRMNEIDEAHKP